MNDTLKRTHLYDWHVKHGDVTPFAGWSMPVRYTSIREEHMTVRNSVGIFDTSHMSRFIIKGPQAQVFLQTLTTNNVNKLKVNGGQYTTCLNEHGGIHDDLTLYRVGEDEYIWITNASNGPKIHDHLMKHSSNFEVEVIDKSREITMIAVQGPKALQLIQKTADRDIGEYSRFSCYRVRLAGYDCYLCRTGYTGEDGVEILVIDTPFNDEGKEKAISFWEELLKQGEELGVKPCGLGARDSTRLEAGFVLYGHELDENTSPIEARIPYAVKFKVEPHYIGYEVVRHHKTEGGIKKTRIGLEMIDRGIPRENYPVLLTGEHIGKVSSGGLAPTLNKGIALAFVKPETVNTGDIVEIDIKGRMRKAEVVNWPFYDPAVYGASRTQ
ncbi:MAG: putative aminomethyltransferase [Candidatus Thorarchaeota archaeon AB_25]|nr:MAG: putative aminomethyltransferase [Candidatus Thorarchaeota archaeon AB_25]